MAARRIIPISKDEFSRMLEKCNPPPGWSGSIGVANSGGPDSTCLLFLLNRYLANRASEQAPHYSAPQKVLSLTIDHDLQPSSAAMAEHCSKFALSIGVDHITQKINWSEPPYPPRPSPGDTFEKVARDARYHALFESVTREDIGLLAFGHHADDQVETSLMRLGRGSKEIGAGGMRSCRRWGMGIGREGSLGWTGYEGMKRWIIRPLLDISKDRIFATCEDNNLNYITDSTNFQPHITLRNALRHTLANNKNILQPGHEAMPPDIAQKLNDIETAVAALDSVSISLRSKPEELRSAVSQLTSNVVDIDRQVDANLKRCTLPSPPGTHLVSIAGLSRVHDETIRHAMILRIMRCVSFHPWGSLRADGDRRQRRIAQIAENLWVPNPFAKKIRMFVAGGGVLWTPVTVKDGRIRTPDRIFAGGVAEDGRYAWLASRQPPLHRSKMEALGETSTLEINITSHLVRALRGWKAGAPSTIEILYDCRFIITFDLNKMPKGLAQGIETPNTKEKILILSNTRWYWPQVVREWFSLKTVLHSEIDHKPVNTFLSAVQKNIEFDHTVAWKLRENPISAEWINIKWIRPLDAI
ncbi:PP-loop family-domain-containing protein [Collybia nuda]|uniref:tRNA(Ile)-lysidine synthetase n=1 Tax=Collybia nuda TaxID=64659 RepID=A0A9P5YK47_9AGAR|nr:PP-loop family-domain-containing protein [Collybia nuda]